MATERIVEFHIHSLKRLENGDRRGKSIGSIDRQTAPPASEGRGTPETQCVVSNGRSNAGNRDRCNDFCGVVNHSEMSDRSGIELIKAAAVSFAGVQGLFT